MTLHLPIEVLYILYQMQTANHEVFIVGGAVRDILINSINTLDNLSFEGEVKQDIKDFDFATKATPEQIQEVFPESFYENKFGTVGIAHKNLLEMISQSKLTLSDKNMKTALHDELNQPQERIIDAKTASKIHSSLESEYPDQTEINDIEPPPFELTTYRSDGVYRDSRRPVDVKWGETLQQDLDRRDFTINAMAISVDQEFLKSLFEKNSETLPEIVVLHSENYQLVDHHNGMKDLTEKDIRTVGDPHRRFNEDALRMLRAIRFAVQLKMNIDPNIKQAIKDKAQLIQNISGERIGDELFKMLISDFPANAIKLLDETGLLEYIMPELLESKGVEQGGHHTTDVWTHNLDALQECPSRDPIVKLATLLHDVGKPATYKVINGGITFYNHEIIGSRIASKIGKRLRLSKKEQDRLFTLVRYHMFYYQPENSDASIRRFMRKVSLENIDDILALREGDRLGSGARKTSWRLEEMKQRMIEQLHQPMDVGDLAINGHDLMEHFKLQPGPILGDVLNNLFEQVLENPDLNDKEKLLELAKEVIDNAASS